MKWEFGLKMGEERKYQDAYRRLDSLGLSALLDWSLQASNGTYMALEMYQRDQDPVMLDEARTGALALLAATKVLEDRLTR